MDRRTFLGLAAAGAARPLLPFDRTRALRGTGTTAATGSRRGTALQDARHPLRIAPVARPEGLTLTARAAEVDVGPGMIRALTLNGSVPSPTIRVRRGTTARIDLVNRLDQPTILHWHGLAVPYEADGHPRWQIGPGETFRYDFPVIDRPGTYWYHPHTHERTAEQTYRGMGGLFIVEGDEAEEHGLPGAGREIPLVLQDKRLAGSLDFDYGLGMGPDMMLGYLGDTAFGNGVPNPTLGVERARYRLRVVNGSNTRIFQLGLSTGGPLTLIGTDGGLLGAPVALETIMVAPAERVDLVVDFSGSRPGERIMLRTSEFEVPGMMGMMGGMGRGRMGRGRGMMGGGGGVPQGTAMDLLELVVREGPSDPGPEMASVFPEVPGVGEVGADTRRRTFVFQSMMMSHTINGRAFDMERIDERVPLGRTEVWTFVNESELPHPVHVHAGQFRVLRRTGGRARVMPWETGLKDTVLVLPQERVDVAVRFGHPGVFLLHCHNLEHEDMGMMSNFEVVE